MKELSIEEKAKRYDEAIDKAKKELDACGSQDCDAARQIFRLFPELKESEDERIRKRLIFDFKVIGKTEWGGLEVKDILAWLEKQGKIVAYYEDRLDECSCKYFNKGYKHALENQGGPKEINID